MKSATASIDRSELRQNALNLMRKADPARLMAVVKADGYGHGGSEVAKALKEVGVDFFAVATLEEGIALREAGIRDRILVMGALMPGSIDQYTQHELEATVGSHEGLDDAESNAGGSPLRAHLKIDTGMGRIGLQPQDAAEAMRRLRSAPNVDLKGLSTHLASADDDDLRFSERQVERFNNAIMSEGVADLEVHIANTEGLARVPSAYKPYPLALVRVGIGLYGCPIRADTRRDLGVSPILRVATKVTHVKQVPTGTPISYNGRWTAEKATHIATVGMGYADGYPRALIGRASVGIGGVRHPVVGTICMDMIMVDLGPGQPEVEVGDEVVLFGPGGPDVSEVARWAGTITYEITTGLGMRVRRSYQ
jgi:alanine racemase